MGSDLLADARALDATLLHWRRHLHAHPELSGHEANTATYVAAALREMGLEPRERVGGMYGLTVDLGPAGGPCVALRADMDALPIQEQTGLPYASRTPGVMHACGHDAHTAMLLGAARLLSARRGELARPVRLIFQPAEEQPPGGAKPMIDAGVLDGVERVYGLHIWSEMPVGTLGTRAGVFMASTDELDIVIRGRGGHAAMPQQCVDPIVAASQVVVALQSITSRSIAMTDSAVVSITQFNGGTASNIIPEEVRLAGTVRTLSEATRAAVLRRLREIVEGVARAHGAEARVEVGAGYPALVNDAAAVESALRAARGLGIASESILQLAAQGGGEDFAYYARRVPSAFVFLGARNEAKGCVFAHHHPRFNIDEDALPLGAALLAALALSAA
ncbi:MAG: amidohydrolase [Phycisphaerales bacterium]|nr:amidohydrolase [Phycisphaerales bacterium]